MNNHRISRGLEMQAQKIEEFKIKENYTIEATFFCGVVKEFDVKILFERFPEYKRLVSDPVLWSKAELLPQGSGVYFDDDLDLTADEIWINGKTTDSRKARARYYIAQCISDSRESMNITQKQLSKKTGISQCDISRIEGGVANPTIDTIAKILEAMNLEIKIQAKAE